MAAGDQAEVTSSNGWAKPIIGFTIVMSFVGFCLALVFLPHAPAVDATIIGIILGALGSNTTGVINFYFGSSSSGEVQAKSLNAALVTAQNGIADKAADKVAAVVANANVAAKKEQ